MAGARAVLQPEPLAPRAFNFAVFFAIHLAANTPGWIAIARSRSGAAPLALVDYRMTK